MATWSKWLHYTNDYIINYYIIQSDNIIRDDYNNLGVNRLRMTVRLVHMMDDVFATICRCIPFFYRTTQILDYLVRGRP